MFHIAICDDNENVLIDLEKKIREILNSKVIISKHNNVFSLMTYVMDEAKGNLDAVFMSSHMKEQNSIETAKQICEEFKTIKIVFMSDHLESALEIFDVTPSYFLLKPLQKEQVAKAIDKVSHQKNIEKMDIIELGMIGRKKISVRVHDIYYFESDRRKVLVHINKKTYSVYKKMTELENDLKSEFIRVHQSYIVNMNKIKEILGKQIVLYDMEDTFIPVSRSRYKFVCEQVEAFKEGKR